MKRNINYTLLFVLAASIFIGACKKTDYKFGQIKTPSDLSIKTTVQGEPADSVGDGSGNVTIHITATNATAYKIYWGDGDTTLVSTDTASHKYTSIGTYTYTYSVNAIGTAGATSTLSGQVRVAYNYVIPADIIANLTGGTAKNWVVAKETPGHFGVGPVTSFTPDYYQAVPNEKAATPCAYAGVITFSLAAPNSIALDDNNMGSSFLISASTSYYGQPGNGDGCYVINPGGTQPISVGADTFAGATSSTGTGVQFTVQGPGLVAFGTGGVTYEILSLTATTMSLRNIGADGNAWYQILEAQ